MILVFFGNELGDTETNIVVLAERKKPRKLVSPRVGGRSAGNQSISVAKPVRYMFTFRDAVCPIYFTSSTC